MKRAVENEIITVGALGVRFLVEADDSNGTASVFECYVPARSRMPAPHSHDGFEETISGLEGQTAWTIDGRGVRIGPGEAVCVQRGQIHGFENHGSLDASRSDPRAAECRLTVEIGTGRRPAVSHRRSAA